jgi:type 1 glutamine amidotransferase
MVESMSGNDFQGQGSASICGFAHEYGKGRVCFLASGHTITTVWNPEYLKIQRNAVLWLLKEL